MRHACFAKQMTFAVSDCRRKPQIKCCARKKVTEQSHDFTTSFARDFSVSNNETVNAAS
jgi:hypothetical protein